MEAILGRLIGEMGRDWARAARPATVIAAVCAGLRREMAGADEIVVAVGRERADRTGGEARLGGAACAG